MAYILPDGRQAVDVTTNKTLAAADSGVVQNAIVDGLVFTLPSTAAGLSFTIRNGGAAPTGGPVGAGSNGSVGINVTPQAADGVTGNGFTAATSKGAVNTKATANVGDEATFDASGTAGTGAYGMVSPIKGIWARQA